MEHTHTPIEVWPPTVETHFFESTRGGILTHRNIWLSIQFYCRRLLLWINIGGSIDYIAIQQLPGFTHFHSALLSAIHGTLSQKPKTLSKCVKPVPNHCAQATPSILPFKCLRFILSTFFLLLLWIPVSKLFF